MRQLFSVWNALDLRKRLTVAIATIAMFAAVIFLGNVASTPSMALLYSGLDASVSGEVVGALEQHGVTYSVKGDSIYVDSSQRDLMRMTLASEGLPATGLGGYELLDSLTGFGTTSQMFDATYWRAKEGELARTILAWPQIKSARVHISNQAKHPFGKSPIPVASVSLKLSSGALSSARVRALRFLIASAVAGLSPEKVSVIDTDRGLIGGNGSTGTNGAYSGRYTKKLKEKLERLLTAHVGPQNAIVELTIDASQEKETIVEKRFDPQGRVAISTDTQEVSGNSSNGGSSGVTVASNLPEGSGGKSNQISKNNRTDTHERVNYEVSQTTRETIRLPGKITRISVAVLVNQVSATAPDGTTTWSPRSDGELASLLELVKSAIGFNAKRGDIVTIKSLRFQAPAEQGTLAVASPFAAIAANSLTLIQSAVLALVILGLGLFVVRPILTSHPLTALPSPQDDPLPDEGNAFADDGFQFAIAGPDDGSALSDNAAEDPIAHLREIIAERQDETVEVLRNWIETSEEPA